MTTQEAQPIHCPKCLSTDLKTWPDEVDSRCDDYECNDCGCTFEIDR